MRYKIEWQYKDFIVTFEDYEEEVLRTSTRYFKCFNAYQDFLQELDMVGDTSDKILSEESISDFKSEMYISIARLIYKLGGWRFKVTVNLFYKFMKKALVPLYNHELCEAMDLKAWSHMVSN